MTTKTRIAPPNRADILRDRVQGLARELGPGAKFPKVADLCRDWQVSPTTLNRVLTDLEGDGWIRRKHAVGVFVADDVPLTHLLSSVALICRPSFFQGSGHSPFWELLIQASQESAQRHGLECDLYFSREPEEARVKPLPEALSLAFENHKIGAVIGIGLDDVAAMWLMERGVPVVNVFGKGHVIIGFNDELAMSLSVRSALERGCHNLALCVDLPPQTSPIHKALLMERWPQLCRQELHDRNFLGDFRVEIADFQKYPQCTDQGFDIATKLFSDKKSSWPDAVISVNDMFTHGMLSALRKMGIEVGREVQIITHSNANSPILHGESELVRIEYDRTEIVRAIWRELENLLVTRHWPEDKHVNIAPHRA